MIVISYCDLVTLDYKLSIWFEWSDDWLKLSIWKDFEGENIWDSYEWLVINWNFCFPMMGYLERSEGKAY